MMPSYAKEDLMLHLFLLLLACGEKESDSKALSEEDTLQENEAEEPPLETGGEPLEEESPDDFDSTCFEGSMNNSTTVLIGGESHEMTEAVWDIEEFGFMTVVLGIQEEGSLCARILDKSHLQKPILTILMTGEGGLSSSESYHLSVDVTNDDPGMEYASISFEDGFGGVGGFASGSVDVSSYTYGVDMTLSISAGGDDTLLSATDISACYCPGALEIIADL
jgi:hypothetical protein